MLQTIDLADEAAGTPVRVDVHVRASDSPHTVIHRGRTTVRLRPDPHRHRRARAAADAHDAPGDELTVAGLERTAVC